jgi:hypothetical protein
MGLWDKVKTVGKGFATGGVPGAIYSGVTGRNAWSDALKASDRDPNDLQGQLAEQGGLSSAFAGQSEGDFRTLGGEATTERDYLRRIARGDESVSRMQLGQALQQNQAAQQSMAAGARPGNAAMAARTAAMTAGRQGAGLAGQQAIAGIQERQAAQQSLGNMLMQQRQQELQGALGGRSNANNAFTGALTGAMNTPTDFEKALGLLTDAGAGAAKVYGA